MKKEKKYLFLLIYMAILLFLSCARYDQPVLPESISDKVKINADASDSQTLDTEFYLIWLVEAGLGNMYDGYPIRIRVETVSGALLSAELPAWYYNDDKYGCVMLEGNRYSSGMVYVIMFIDADYDGLPGDDEPQVSGYATAPGCISLAINKDGSQKHPPAFIVNWKAIAGIGSMYDGSSMHIRVETLDGLFLHFRQYVEWYDNYYNQSGLEVFIGNEFSLNTVRVILFIDTDWNQIPDAGEPQVSAEISGHTIVPCSISLTLGG